MSTLALQRDAFKPRPPDSKGPGFALALLAHALLVVALAFGVNWHASEPEGVEAELWAAVPQIAAPKATEPEPAPVKVEPKPEPKPLVKPEPRPEPKQETRPDAQIAIEKARKEDERKKKEEAEKLAQQQKAEKIKLEKEDKRKKQQEEQRLAAEHEKRVKEMLARAGDGDKTSPGTDKQTASPSASYAGRIVGYIRPRISYPPELAGTAEVEVQVTIAPDGTVLASRLLKPSGNSSWDEAVLNAIALAGKLPLDNGRVHNPMIITFRAKDR